MSDDPYQSPESSSETSATIDWSRHYSIPELSELSDAEQEAVLKASYRKTITRWLWWINLGTLAPIGIGLGPFCGFLIDNSWTVQPPSLLIGSLLVVFGVIVIVMVICLWGIGMDNIEIRFMRRYIRAYLNDRESNE